MLRYVVPIRPHIDEAMDAANTRLERAKMPNVWLSPAPSLMPRLIVDETTQDTVYADHSWDVLVDPQLLKEVLKNVFYNVRYTLRTADGAILDHPEQRARARLSIERAPAPEPEGGMMDYVFLRVISDGVTPTEHELRRARDSSTLAQQAIDIAEFGGELRLDALPDAPGAVVSLRLMTRRAPSDRVDADRHEGVGG